MKKYISVKLFFLHSFLLLIVVTQFKAQSPCAQYNHWIVGDNSTSNVVWTIVNDSNYAYVGGMFEYAGPPTGTGAKISTTNTSPDLNYCRPSGIVNCVVSDGVGGWFIGGNFGLITTSCSTMVIRNNIAHILSNGQLDMTWNPNANNTVTTLVLSGNDLFVGGSFTIIGAQNRNYLAKLSATGTGTADATWNPSPNNLVHSIAVSGGDLFVAGGFNIIGGIWRKYLAKLSATGTGTVDAIWNPNPDLYGRTLLLNGNDLFVSGAFTNIGGQARNRIAKLSTSGTGAADPIWNPNADEVILSFAISGNDLFAAGQFTSIGGQIRNGLAKLSTTGTGNVDAFWNPNPNDVVQSVIVSGSDLIVAGDFTIIGGQTRNYISKLSTTGTGAANVIWNPNPNDKVYTLALSGSDLYVGGKFISIGGVKRKNLARFSKINGMLDTSWDPNPDDVISTLLLSGSELYVGGKFTNIGGQARNRIAKLSTVGTGTADASWNPNSNSWVYSLSLSGSALFVGGSFTNIGGTSVNRIAKLSTVGTGTADFTWNPNPDAGIESITLSGSDLFVTGVFANIGGQARSKIAKISTVGTGTADATWNPNPDNWVRSMLVSGSDLYVGGLFTNIGGQARNYIAKLSTTGTGAADAIWNPNADNEITSFALSGSDLYAGGSFSNIGGQVRYHIAKLSTVGTGTADATWNPWPDGHVYSINLSGSDVYIGGIFRYFGNIFPRVGVALVGNYCGPTTPALSVSNATICSGQTSSLSITSGSLYTATNWQWYNSSCGTGSVGSGTTITVSPTTTSTYFVRGEGGCAGTTANCATLAVVVNPTPTISVASTGSVCEGTSINLVANGALSYTWSTGALTPSINVTPTISTTYTINGVSGSGCSNTQIVNVVVNNTCQDVWPGDANSDGIANNLDVLELGLHFTNIGVPRANVSNNWQPYFSNNWSGTISTGKNLNHSDCNGDGVINSGDTMAINLNYASVHAFKMQQYFSINSQLRIIPDQINVIKGTWGTASIHLGDSANIINNINGLAFTVDFDSTLIETDSIWIEYLNSFLDAGQNLRFRKLDFINGKIYTATTHTNNTNVNGQGLIARLHYKIIPNLTNDTVLNIGLSQAFHSSSTGTLNPLTVGTASLMAIGASIGIKELSNNSFYISPNPTEGILNIKFDNINENVRIEILNTLGQVLISEKSKENNLLINISNYPAGVYFIKITIADKYKVIKVIKE